MFGVLNFEVDATVAVRDVPSEEDCFRLDSKLNAVASFEVASMPKAMTELTSNSKTHDIPTFTTAAMHSISNSASRTCLMMLPVWLKKLEGLVKVIPLHSLTRSQWPRHVEL